MTMSTDPLDTGSAIALCPSDVLAHQGHRPAHPAAHAASVASIKPHVQAIPSPLPEPCAPHSNRAALSRRSWLAGSLGALAGATATVVQPRAAVAAPSSIPAEVDPGALIHRLVDRTSFAITPADISLATSLGYSGFLEYQLDHLNIPEDPALVARLGALPTLTYSGQQLYDSVIVPNSSTIVNELIEAAIVRAVSSKRQLFERMVEFWTDHFNIDIAQSDSQYLKTLDDRAIRQHALTSFPQLLNASARSPAMLAYLDNDASSNGLINENYSRELIELHTVGADYFYSFPPASVQATIIAVARCLTGWGRYGSGFNDTSPGGTGTTLRGQFYYNTTGVRNRVTSNGVNFSGATAGAHDTGIKALGTIFGSAVIPAGRTGAAGQQDAQDVLNLLTAHSATATYISTKLCQRFLGEGVPTSIINAVRDTYLNAANPQGIGDIKAMLRVILSPNILAGAFPRFKRPFHLFCGAMRALPTTIISTSTLRTQLVRAGHLPFAWSPPDGYPDTTAYWTGQVLPRWSFCAALVTNTSGNAGGISGITVNDTTFFTGATTPAQVVDRIDQSLFAGLMGAADKAALQATLGAAPTAIQRRDAISLALGLPSYQWY